MLTASSSTVISIQCRLLRHSDFWVPVWDKDLNEKAAGIRFVSEENVTVSAKAAGASKARAALTFKGCPNLQHSRAKHISFWLLSVFLINIVLRRWEMVLVSFQHEDAMMIQAFNTRCSSVFWLRSICWVWADSTCRFLPVRDVPVDSTGYCSYWARHKELKSFRVFFFFFFAEDRAGRQICCAVV